MLNYWPVKIYNTKTFEDRKRKKSMKKFRAKRIPDKKRE